MLELSSNTIKVLGVFGRLSQELEKKFDDLELQYGNKPAGDEYNIIRHLTLTFVENATITDINTHLDLLKQLRTFLPLEIKIKKVFIKNEESLPGAQHIAFEFEINETKQLTDFIAQHVGTENTVHTWYIKSVWFIPKHNQQKVIEKLQEIKTLTFTDFYLASNKQNKENTIYTASQFSESSETPEP